MSEDKKIGNVQQENKDDVFEKEFLSMGQLVWRTLKKHKLGIISMWILAIFYLFAIFADFVSPMNPYKQHIQYRFKNSTKVYSKDLITGEKSGMFTYLSAKERDAYTYEPIYKEATHFDKMKVFDEFEEKNIEFELGKYNETFDSTVNNVQYIFKEDIYAVTSSGEKIRLTSKYTNGKSLIPIEFFTDSKYLNGQIEKNGDYYDPGFSKLLSGESVISNVETRHGALKEYKNGQYSSRIKDKDIVSVDTYSTLDSVLVSTENDEYEYYAENILGVNFKAYKLKFFIKSWEYKLLGFIKVDRHLFGVEKTLLPEYSDYLTKDGIVYIWGADKFGRDMFSRILFGSRVSLSIGLIGILITFTIGLFLGGVAGYYGGWVDEVSMRGTEILMSIPSFYLLISLAAILPKELAPSLRYMLIIIILSFIGWPGMSRVIRGMTLGMKETEFIQAAIAFGYPGRKIIWKHLIPNTMTYIIISATLSIPGYIIGEAGLSFLGLGITEPSASWGLMLSQAQGINSLTNYPWLLIPGLFIFITTLAFNLFGDALRDALDPRALGH